MEVEISKEPALWDAYVEAMPEACNYHRWVWQHAIHDTFGHQPYYLAARENGAIRGILPLVSMKSRLFGAFLVSVPFFSYGGVLATTEQAREALLRKAVELARALGARHIELRQKGEFGATWQGVSSKVTMLVPLPASAEELWKRWSSGLRNKIRYAQKHGLRVQWSGQDGVDSFYRVFAANMRNLGTPVYPRKWFENLCKCSSLIRILTLWDDDEPVAGAFLVPFRDTLELPWSASLPESRKKYSQVFLYSNFLEWAVQNGFRRVDLGRCTPGSGTHEFKRHWMCQEQPLEWFYWLAPGAGLPNLHADNSSYRMAVQVWKHLPLAVANTLGPRIVRSIP